MPSQETVRQHLKIWLVWTAAGVFYATQDYLPRLYRNEALSWREGLQGILGWMIPMYICAALTPTLLRIGRRWPLSERGTAFNILLHVVFSAVFSVVTP